MLGMVRWIQRVKKTRNGRSNVVWVFTFRQLRFQFVLVAVIDYLMTILSLNVPVPTKMKMMVITLRFTQGVSAVRQSNLRQNAQMFK